jgi:hypothetical protein
VQAICTASAPSTSSLGATASIIASAAFMASSEIPPQGERHAACIWNKLAFTKSLDVVPRAVLSRRHQLRPSPSGGCSFATFPSAPNTLTRTGGGRCWPVTGAGELFGLFIIRLSPAGGHRQASTRAARRPGHRPRTNREAAAGGGRRPRPAEPAAPERLEAEPRHHHPAAPQSR